MVDLLQLILSNCGLIPVVLSNAEFWELRELRSMSLFTPQVIFSSNFQQLSWPT